MGMTTIGYLLVRSDEIPVRAKLASSYCLDPASHRCFSDHNWQIADESLVRVKWKQSSDYHRR
ncbi:hypothetical protein HAX54_014347, partial [Datura stramonium]|nr:hypothetical protein [Datura stramonium]